MDLPCPVGLCPCLSCAGRTPYMSLLSPKRDLSDLNSSPWRLVANERSFIYHPVLSSEAVAKDLAAVQGSSTAERSQELLFPPPWQQRCNLSADRSAAGPGGQPLASSCRLSCGHQPREGREQEEPGAASFDRDVDKGQAGQVPGSCVQAGHLPRPHCHGKSVLSPVPACPVPSPCHLPPLHAAGCSFPAAELHTCGEELQLKGSQEAQLGFQST